MPTGIVKTKQTFKNSENFDLPKASTKDINNIKSLNYNKTTVPEKIPSKLIKLVANIINSNICSILNRSISYSKFPE